MVFRRYGTFTGGIDLPDEKQATLDAPIGPCAPPGRLRVPLAPCVPDFSLSRASGANDEFCGGVEPSLTAEAGRAAAARPIVQVGGSVSAGERIAEADGRSGVDIFAPLSGRVALITTVAVAGPAGFAASPAVELADVSAPAPIAPPAPVFDWQAADAETLRERLAGGGLTTHHTPCRPLCLWVEKARAARCRVLIANVMEGQPYVTADHRLLVEQGAAVIGGLAMLAAAIEVEETILAVDRRRTDDYRALVGLAKDCGVHRIALAHKYPIGAGPMLVKVLTRREVPIGGGTLDVGAAVVDAATCFAVYRWVACARPQTHRVLTVAGERIREPGNAWVPFGTSCGGLAAGAEPPVIHGGPMVGLRCSDDAVTVPGTDAVLAIDTADVAPPSPCIRCGWCSYHCPARLNVAALNDAFELGLIDRARREGVEACVGCGVCTYVCPARLPLTQRARQLKQAVSSMRPAAGQLEFRSGGT